MKHSVALDTISLRLSIQLLLPRVILQHFSLVAFQLIQGNYIDKICLQWQTVLVRSLTSDIGLDLPMRCNVLSSSLWLFDKPDLGFVLMLVYRMLVNHINEPSSSLVASLI